PWVSGPPPKWWRCTTPWNPRPFVTPVTLTRSPAAKIATVTVSPALGASPVEGATGKLCKTRGAVSRPAFFTWPARAFAVRFGFFVPKPNWTCEPPTPTCTTGHGPASMTVTGTCVPSASNTRVMPSFLPIKPVIDLSSLHLDLDVHAGRQIELGQGIDGLGPRIQDVDQPLVRLQLELHLRVVPRHHHLPPRRQLHRPRHIRRPQVKLRPIPLEKRRVPPPLLLRQHVHLALKLRVRRDALRLRQHHPPLHLVLLHPPQQQPDIIPRLPFVQQLAEHL